MDVGLDATGTGAKAVARAVGLLVTRLLPAAVGMAVREAARTGERAVGREVLLGRIAGGAEA